MGPCVLQALLRRLQGTRATKHVQRDRQLSDYNQTMLFGYSVAAAHENPYTKPKKRSPYDNPAGHPSDLSGTHTKSMSSLSRVSHSPSVSGQRSRPQSATVSSQKSQSASVSSQKPRPHSATVRPGSSPVKHHPTFKPLVNPRPAWEDRW